MEFSLLALIGISLAAMFFGYGFGLFEGRGQGYNKRKKEEASDPTLRPVVQPAPVPVPAPAPLPTPAATEEHTLLKLSLDAREQPCLDLDGARVDTARMEPRQRKRLIDLMVVMRPWIESGPIARLQAAPVPVPAPAAAAIPVAAPLPGPPPAAAVVPPGTPAEPVSAPTTMVGQIEAILQSKVMGTPLATRGIHLVESAQGGAMVVVGLNRYAGVGDVPDAEVQAAIRAAIAEWEKKYTPG